MTELSIPFAQFQDNALVALATTIRDWCSKSWIYPGNHGHPIAALSRAFPDLDGSFLDDDYSAALEGKLTAWEKGVTRSIRHWDAHRASDLCRIFPTAVPKACRDRVPVVRKVNGEWHCIYSTPEAAE